MTSTNHNTDSRILKTKRAIDKAFFTLLERESFNSITVLGIVNEAMISQTTFYRHYQDKYDLAAQLMKETLDQLSTMFFRRMDATQSANSPFLPASEFPKLRQHVQLLQGINTPDLSFQAVAVAHITGSIQREMRQRQLSVIYAEEIAAYLANMFYNLFNSMADHPEDGNFQVAREQIRECTEVLNALYADLPAWTSSTAKRCPSAKKRSKPRQP